MAQKRMVRVYLRMPKLFVKQGRKIATRDGLKFSQFVRQAMAREFLLREKENP